MSPAVNSPEWDRLTQRRAELIRKQTRTGLTPAEQTELVRLQALFREAIGRTFPRPGLTAQERELIGGLIARYPTFTQGLR